MEEKIQLTKNIEKIMERNLEEKGEEFTEHIECCEDCNYYDKFWIWGRHLHCCAYNSDDPNTSRDVEKIYNECPMNHERTYTKSYVKQYGIINREPTNYDDGSISIVDFKHTHYESDGHNPTVDYEYIANFFYSTQEECDKIMPIVYYYYKKLNIDSEWVEKRCYG